MPMLPTINLDITNHKKTQVFKVYFSFFILSPTFKGKTNPWEITDENSIPSTTQLLALRTGSSWVTLKGILIHHRILTMTWVVFHPPILIGSMGQTVCLPTCMA